MNKEIDKATLNLLNLVIANRAEEAIEIMENNRFDEGILDAILQYSECGDGSPHVKLPLYIITLANEIYFAGDDFRDNAMTIVARNRKNIARLKEYWESKGYPTNNGVNFSDYKELVAHFDEEVFTFKELLDGELDDLVKMGYDENEAKFCYALLTYDKPEIDRQIKLGTNPDVWISGDVSPELCDDILGYSGISTAYDSISDAQICYDLWGFWESLKGDKLPVAEWNTLRGLLGAAAYQELIPELERLSPDL